MFFFSLSQSYKQIYSEQINTQQIPTDYILFRTILLQYPKYIDNYAQKRGTTSCGRSPCGILEFGRNLHIYGIVVPIGARAIIRVGVIELEQVVFAQSVVGR